MLFGIVDEADITSLQDWIMPNSIPQMSKVGDKLVMLFHADDPSRATGDNTVLMYSVYENNVWSEPKPVWASDTADLFFDQIVVNDELYVVWQKQNSKVTKVTPEELLAETARNAEICYAKWNKNNNSFEQQRFITNNTVLDMYPTVAVNGSEVSVVWVSNSVSDPFGTSGKYSIMKSSLVNGNFSTPVKVYETTDYISDISAGFINNKLAAIALTGFDVETAAVIYISDDETKNVQNSVTASAPKFNNGKFYWQLGGAIYEYDPVKNLTTEITAGFEKVISSSYKLVNNKDKSAIVWVDVTDNIYSLKASILSGNSWSAPITLLTLDDNIIQYMDVSLLDNGNWQVVMNNLKKDSDRYSLMFANINTKTDISLESAYANERDKNGNSLPINYSVKNLGENTVERVHLKIYTGDHTYVDKFVTCKIEPGATVNFTENIDVSNIDIVTDVAIYVESEDESNLTDNSAIIKIGLVDVSVSLSRYQIDQNTIVVNAHIKNESKTPANVAISVIEDSLDGIVLDVKNLGVLSNEQDYIYIYTIDITKVDFRGDDKKSYFFKIDTLEPNLNSDISDVIIVYPIAEENIGTEQIEEIVIVPVTGISLSRKTVELTINGEIYESMQLSATIYPQNATNKGVMWEVENADIAHIDSEGVITARSAGKTKVIAKSYDGEFIDEAIVTVSDVAKYQLTIKAGTGGTITKGSEGKYLAGESIEISAKANSGYVFKNWTSSNGGTFADANSASTTFTMPSNDTTITANFESTGGGGGGGGTTTYTVKFETNGGSKIANQYVAQNEKAVQPDAPTKHGFTFAGWYLDKELTKEYDFNTLITANITLYAKWIDEPTKTDEWVNRFTDVKDSDWFYDAVQFVAQKGITQGISATLFDPQGKVTRAQFITMLCRAYGIEERTGDNFSDAGDTWYTGYLAAAKQLGISNGVGDNMFAPEQEITREQMVTLIYNYVKSISRESIEEWEINLPYADKDSISSWAIEGVMFGTIKKWVKGKDNNSFVPQGKATRAELAQIFYNMFTVENE